MNKKLETNSTLSHYRIISKIGAGGMGEVYLAQDTKLDRKVALKILPAEFAEDEDRMNRFVREAKSVSALNHPNIITIHEIGESDGTHFIATEFIDGKTLGDYAKSNLFNYKSALEIAIQIVSALDEAHQAGIVHRDIKPDNIMVRANGLAKILDFGIAKLSAPTTSEGEEAATMIQAQTQAGLIIGTPNYMSPEQTRGRDVDHQTDIFSFGVVFYEMLSGASPFAGDTVGDTLAAVLMKEPPRLTNAPPEFAEILDKTLQKDKRSRYQTAKDLLDDLREIKQELEFQDKLKRTSSLNQAEAKTHVVQAQNTAEDEPKFAVQNLRSIVVLPFSNIGADAEDDYFSDGLTEEIISDLSNIKSLRVISRNSAMKLKGAGKDLKTITEELSVRYVLDGSVRKAGDKLRISVQLIDGATDANLWAEKYTGSLDDIFEIQESVSHSIAEALKITLTTGEIKQIEERPISDAQAYDLYLRARTKFLQGNPEALDRSIELLKQGLEIIGENELLYAALGYTYYFYFRWISKLDENYLRLANECMEKTFAINPKSSYGYSLQGFLQYSEGKIEQAIKSLTLALDAEPNNPEALLWVAVFNSFVGNHEKAAKYVTLLLSIDPLLSINTQIKGFTCSYQGKFDEAMIWIEKGLAMDAPSPLLIWNAAVVKAWGGKIDEAIVHVDILAEIAPGWIYTEHALFLKHALRGDKELALSHYTPDFDKEAQYDCHFALHVAHCFALIGEKEKALDFLETAVRAGLVNNRFLSETDPLLENIRGELRFESLMKEAERLFEEMNDAADGTNLRAAPENAEEPQTQILPAVTTAETGIGNSIAVLPFANMSADEENEYFCDGLAEELLNALSKIEELKVAARTSAFSFKGKNTKVSEIGEQLSVKNVLEGSVRRSGNRLRISVQLVNASDGYQIWSERYDREMKDIFDVQDEIALAVVDSLKLKLFGDEKAALLKRYTENAEAYQLYLKGRFYYSKFTAEGFTKSIEYYEQALAIEPNYAPAYAELSVSYICFWYLGFGETARYISLAEAAANKALALDQSLAEAHFALALFDFNYEWNWTEAEKAFKRAMELNPSYAENYEHYGMFLAVMERSDEAVAVAQHAIELAPLALKTIYIAGWAFWFAGRLDLAQEQGGKLLEMEPNFSGGHIHLGISLWKEGAYQKSLAALETAVKLGGGNEIKMLLGLLYGIVGEREKANNLLVEFGRLDEQGIFTATHQAFIRAGLGEMDHAFDLLEQAIKRHEGTLVFLKHFSSLSPKFHNHSKMADLLNRIGLPTDKINQTDESPESNTVLLNSTTGDSKQGEFVSEIADKSIAVLPFTDMSADGDQEYFCDGLAEELLNALAKIDKLKVAARTSAFAFKGKNVNASEVANILKVKTILEGSVRRAGNQLRISVQLINAADGYHLWSERYDREMKGIFDLQDEITLAVVDALKLKLFGGEKAEILKRYTDDAEVHELFLKGRYYSYKYSATGWQRAIEFFTKAIERQPDFAPAHAGLAACYCYLWFFGFLPAEEMVIQSKKATARALELDENLAEAYLSQAMVTYCYDWQWEKSEREFKQSIRLNPNYAEALSHYAVFLSMAERFDEAIAQGKRALEIDPLAPLININVGWTYFSFGLSNEALKLADKMIEIEPDLYGAYWLKGAIRLSEGEYEAAARELKKAVLLGGRQIVLSDLASAYALAGDTDKAAALLEQLLEMREQEYVPAVCLARVYSRLGETDKTIEWLEKAFEERNGEMVFLKGEIEGAAEGDALRSLAADPRLIEILNKMNLP